MYDYMVEELLKDNSFKLVRNILQELKKENFNIFDKIINWAIKANLII